MVLSEFPNQQYSTKTRRTLKIKLDFHAEVKLDSDIAAIQIFTPSEMKKFQISFIINQESQYFYRILNVQMFNGYFSDFSIQKQIESGCTTEVFGVMKMHPEDFDGTNLMISDEQQQPLFSISLSDIEKDGFIIVPHYGVAIVNIETPSSKVFEYFDYLFQLKGKTVLERIMAVPERSLEDALLEFRGKRIFYAPIGIEGIRAKGAITPEGFFSVASQFIRKVPGPDTKRIYWPLEYNQIQFIWGMDSKYDLSQGIPIWMRKPEDRRYCNNLPIFETYWKAQPNLSIYQIGFTSLVDFSNRKDLSKGDEIPIGLFRLRIINHEAENRSVFLSVNIGSLSSLFPDATILESIFDVVKVKPLNIPSDSFEVQWMRNNDRKDIRTEFKMVIKAEKIQISTDDKGIITLKLDLSHKMEKILDFAIPF